MSDVQHDPEGDLAGAPAVEMLREIVGSAHTCMLVTQHDRFPFHARPMGAQGVDADGTVWFLSASDSQKNADIEQDPRVTLVVRQHKYRDAQVAGANHRSRSRPDRETRTPMPTLGRRRNDPRVTLLALRPYP